MRVLACPHARRLQHRAWLSACIACTVVLQRFIYMLFVAGLNRAFSSGVIYCSPITATLLTKDMGMPAERVIPLPVDTPIAIDGVSVTLMDANHCPGACMMLFKVPSKNGKPQVQLPSLRQFTILAVWRFLHTLHQSFVHVITELTGYIYVASCYLVLRLWRHGCSHNRQCACHPHT